MVANCDRGSCMNSRKKVLLAVYTCMFHDTGWNEMVARAGPCNSPRYRVHVKYNTIDFFLPSQSNCMINYYAALSRGRIKHCTSSVCPSVCHRSLCPMHTTYFFDNLCRKDWATFWSWFDMNHSAWNDNKHLQKTRN